MTQPDPDSAPQETSSASLENASTSRPQVVDTPVADTGVPEVVTQDVATSPASPATATLPPPGDYRASAGKYFRNVRYIFALVAFALGLYFFYDGYVAYPAERENFRRVDAEVRQTPPEDPRYQELLQERGRYRDHSDADLFVQRFLGFLLTIGSVAALARWLYVSRGQVRLDPDDVLHAPGHPPVAPEDVRWLDDSLWQRKGVAYVHYEKDDRKGRIRLDDFIYERGPVDQIHDRVKHLTARNAVPAVEESGG